MGFIFDNLNIQIDKNSHILLLGPNGSGKTTTIKLILADGDMVVSLLEYRGTHATIKREAVWREAWFVRLSEGKIVESWPITDLDSYFRHLGYQLIPPNS